MVKPLKFASRCSDDSLASFVLTHEKREKRRESECLDFSWLVLLLRAGVVPQGGKVGLHVLIVKDALDTVLQFDTCWG